MSGSSVCSDPPEPSVSKQHCVYPDQSWRTTAGRKLCWSLAAPPASGYGSPLRWPEMKRSVTMVNAPSSRMFLSSDLLLALSASLGVAFCVYAAMQSRSGAPRLLYAQRSAEFELSAFSLNVNTWIGEVPRERSGPARIGCVSPSGRVGFGLPFAPTIIIWKRSLRGWALRGCRFARRNSKRSLVSSLSVTSPAQSPLLSPWIVARLPRVSGVSNAPLVPGLERLLKGGQSLSPEQARVHSEAEALFEVFIGARWS